LSASAILNRLSETTPSTKADQAVARFAEATRLEQEGSAGRAVEMLHAAAELAVDELAEREGIEIEGRELGWHEARARAAARLRTAGAVPAGFDNLLRRLNDDRKRTRYDAKRSRFDPLTLAQARASVGLVVESLGATVEEPALPPPAAPPPEAPQGAPPSPALPPPHRRWPLAVLITGVVLAIAGVVAIVIAASGDDAAQPVRPKRAGPPAVAYNATARLNGLTYRINDARTLRVLNRGDLKARSGGRFILVEVRVSNISDRTLPQRIDAFRVRGGRGAVFKPILGLERFTLAIRPKRREALLLPFDVHADQVRNARLLVDATTASGAKRRLGLTMDLALDDGLGDLVPGTWTGTTSQGKPFRMTVEKGDVIRALTFGTTAGPRCTVRLRGAVFVENASFQAGQGPRVEGRFSSSVDAAGSAQAASGKGCDFGSITWKATRRGG
jgi:hypothetical protein